MAISETSYPRDQFYNDLTNYIRAHTPHKESEEWRLLESISEYIGQLTFRTRPPLLSENVVRAVKLFGNTLNKRLKDGYDSFQSNPISSIKQLTDTNHALQIYRERCVVRVTRPSLTIPSELQRTVLLVDEYLSNRLESTLADINTHIDTLELGIDKDGIKYKIRNILERELDYRIHKSEQFFTKKTTEADREYFYYRQSLLKKFVALPLFLKITKRKQERKYRNAIASFGAALAAAWSQFADQQSYRVMRTSDFGFQFVAVALFAVIIYVFKDRIKDLSKEYVNEKLKDHMPDFKGFISHQELGTIGTTDEYVRFMDEKNVASEIHFLRRLEGRWDVEPPLPDTVLHYHRSVDLQNNKNGKNVIDVSAIKDILRFNFSYFLKHLDDPLKQFAAYDHEDGAKFLNAPKVYHLNLVIRMTTSSSSSKPGHRVDFERYRLVFNRYGILRMETSGEKGKLFYLEGEA